MIDSYDSPWMDEELHIMRDAVAKFSAERICTEDG